MPFLGNRPAENYISYDVQHFTTSATTNYTLDHAVANENELRLVINNVVQQPGSSYAYSASGTSLTLTSATSATDTMYCVYLGKARSTVTPASGSVTGDMLSKPLNYDSGTLYLDDTNNRVGIGTTSPNAELEIKADTPEIRIDSTASSGRNYKIHSDGDELYLEGIGSSGSLKIGESGTYGVNIDLGSGSVGIGKSPDGSVATTGVEFATEGYGLLARSGNTVLYVNRKTNDGTVISIRQDTVEEGTISVSGGTVSYNGFTGTHWSRFQDNSTPTILKGTVLESLDEMCDWYNLQFDVTDEEGNTYTQDVPHVLLDTQSEGDIITYNHEGTDYQATITKEADIKHMKSKVSDTVDAKNVYGVFSSYDNNYEEGYNDFYVASVGSFVVRIKANETIAKGDLLQSNGDGTAKVQTDDNVKSSSFAKVLSTTIIETYEDGSFIVPCSLMC